MYRWHFDNSETEAVVYGDNREEANIKIGYLFPDKWNTFNLIGVEEMLSLEEKIG